ncbi:MAG TPA: coproporphyrinogen III oxidase [Flavobacterium sp.]|nr:coproporphyrinogen III oxidase [Flavobacterium sp.]
MSGIYIHIPFCRQACYYCDFHFSTSLKKKAEMISALATEIALRKSEFQNHTVETIYFGGGTPSILAINEIEFLINEVYKHYKVVQNPEITLEANPDDLNDKQIVAFSKSSVNRLSIGIQSFFEDDLKMLNRIHSASEAARCLDNATAHFENISIDLIYGIPGLTNEKWLQNIEKALSFRIPHISSYALTVEPKTALESFIKRGVIQSLNDDVAQKHFHMLAETLEGRGFIHYELSNFCKPNYFSKNNSSYWLGKHYIGIGPSAHSYNGHSRSWNIANNTQYIKALQTNVRPFEAEILSKIDSYNEYVMTGIRTIWGISLEKIENEFGATFLYYLQKQSDKFIKGGLLEIKNNSLKATKKGMFLSDGMASDLFLVTDPEAV